MILSIQYFRAVAAIYVVLLHSAAKLQVEHVFFSYGASGVDLFFIISGFVITNTFIVHRTRTPLDFFARRVIRIVPIYWLLTLIFAGVLFFFPELFKTYVFDWNALFRSIFFIPSEHKPVIYTGWTLNYEMFFYVIFTLAMIVNKDRTILIVSLVLLSLVFLGRFLDVGFHPVFSMITSTMMIEFCLGCVMCWIYLRGVRIPVWGTLCFIAVGLGLFFFVRTGSRVIDYGLPWLFIYAGVVFCNRAVGLNRFALTLGNSSYSIYLIHVVSLPALHALFKKLNLIQVLSTASVLFSFLLLATASGVICYYLLEKPVTNWFQRRFRVA